jgi:hypothetical protein
MTDADLIRRVQDGVRFLDEERIRFVLDHRLVREVTAYLESSWDSGSHGTGLRFVLEAVLVSIRYPDLLRHAREGVANTRRFVGLLVRFLRRIESKDPPPEVARPVSNLLALIDRLQLEKLGGGRRPWTVFRADRFLRMERRGDMQRLLHLVSELDALMAMAEALEAFGLTLPEVVDEPRFTLEGEGIVHPFLPAPVANPVQVSGGESLVFLTGPNMAGKTTYLKAVAVSAYLAHVGMGVPASRLRISTLDGVMTSITPEENLRGGLSFFMAEVERVREVAEAVAGGGRILAMFDEVFRGTNVADARDASRLVILGFARSRTSGFVFSSHLVELAEDLRMESSVRFAFFEGRIEEGRARYDFRLREGVSSQRLGLQLLAERRVPDLLKELAR